MYDNIGRKIKGIAAFVGIAGAIISAIAFAILMLNGAFAAALGSLLGAPLFIVLSFPLYGFGELIEKVSQIADGKAADSAAAVSNDLPEL